MQAQVFDCQIFVPRRGLMKLGLPAETGPVKIARLDYIGFEEMSDPEFRRLLAAFQSIPLASLRS